MSEWLWRLLGWPATFNLTEGIDPTFDFGGVDDGPDYQCVCGRWLPCRSCGT